MIPAQKIKVEKCAGKVKMETNIRSRTPPYHPGNFLVSSDVDTVKITMCWVQREDVRMIKTVPFFNLLPRLFFLTYYHRQSAKNVCIDAHRLVTAPAGIHMVQLTSIRL